ncbi:MAG: type II toxin-antitoxin system HicB family antitoxin [Desulfovibrio sp.]|nr:type II toxin-antitoxin system HicB family antitoxin [Desulfovibrio sp.]
MNESEYAVILSPDDNGAWLVTCGVLPEVTTFGETREEALKNAVFAIEEALKLTD